MRLGERDKPWMTEMMSPRWITNCASLAERLYELRPCQTSSLVRKLNWVMEKSAASDACRPSFPTIPTPVIEDQYPR